MTRDERIMIVEVCAQLQRIIAKLSVNVTDAVISECILELDEVRAQLISNGESYKE